MRKLISRNNKKSVSKFQYGGIPTWTAPYLQLYIDKNNPRDVFVLGTAARQANIPMASQDPSSSTHMYDYGFLGAEDTGKLPGRIAGVELNPETVYFMYDPNTGTILNDSSGHWGLETNPQNMVPLDETWAYNEGTGEWYQIPQVTPDLLYDTGQIERQNSLANLNEQFGLAMGAQVPFMENLELLDASMNRSKSLLQNLGVGILGLGAEELTLPIITKGLSYVPKVGTVLSLYPRAAANAIAAGSGFGQGYAMSQNDLSLYMENIGTEFTDNDFKNISRSTSIDDMLLWLSNHGYDIIEPEDPNGKPEISTSYYVHPYENKLFGKDRAIWWDNAVAGGLWGLSKITKFPKKGGWVLPTYALFSGIGRTAYYGSTRAKARMLANYLVSHGYATYSGASEDTYSVQTDLNNNPLVTDTMSELINKLINIPDSNATAIDYGSVENNDLGSDYNEEWNGSATIQPDTINR